MTSDVWSTLLLVCLTWRQVHCDYRCLCSYQVELEILEKPDPSSNVIGYMYEFDCKPSYQVDGLDKAYSAVGSEGKLGYVVMTSNIQIQTCQGSIPDIDRVKTTTTRLATPTTLPRTTSTKATTPTGSSTVSATPTSSSLTSTTLRVTPSSAPTTTLPTTKFLTTVKLLQNSCPTIVKQNASVQNIFQHNGICYEFVPVKNNWKYAQTDCKSKGGHLVSIENEDQQSFVSSMLSTVHVTDPVWLGLHDRVNEEHWQWDTGMPANYTNWYPGRFIDQYHDQEDCGLMIPNRKHRWDDVDCNGITFEGLFKYNWICQYM